MRQGDRENQQQRWRRDRLNELLLGVMRAARHGVMKQIQVPCPGQKPSDLSLRTSLPKSPVQRCRSIPAWSLIEPSWSAVRRVTSQTREIDVLTWPVLCVEQPLCTQQLLSGTVRNSRSAPIARGVYAARRVYASGVMFQGSARVAACLDIYTARIQKDSILEPEMPSGRIAVVYSIQANRYCF